MNTSTPFLGSTTLSLLMALCLVVIWIWHRNSLRHYLAVDRATWRREIARGLSEASTKTAEISEAAAAALAVVAEVVQGTGEMGVLEASVLHERVLEGTHLDDRRARATLLLRMATMLQGVTGAREFIRVMQPGTRRDTSLRDDALALLDAAQTAYRGTDHPAQQAGTDQ